MHFLINSHKLAYALNKCSRLARPQKTYPIARNVLIEAKDDMLSISATDMLHASVVYRLHDLTISEEGSALVDASTLAVFASAVNADLELYITKANRLMVKSKDKKISLKQGIGELVINALPEMPAVVKTSGSVLRGATGISFLCADADTFSSLAGTLITTGDGRLYSMAANTDRAGYTWANINYDGKGQFLLPQKVASLLSYFLYDEDEVDITVDGNKIWFETDRFVMSANQLNGIEKFPYDMLSEMVVANREHSIIVDIHELERALETCFALADVENKLHRTVKFVADHNDVSLLIETSEDNELGQMNWSVLLQQMDGKPFQFYISAQYLQDLIKAVQKLTKTGLYTDIGGRTGLITISLAEREIMNDEGESTKMYGPAMFSSNSINALFMIMPMALPEPAKLL